MRKHIVRLAAFIGLAVGLSLGQSNPQSLTYPVNMYGQWSGQVFSGSASIGVGSIAVTTSGFFIPGGNRSINPLAKNIPLRIDTEFITPSSVSCQLAAQLAISGLSGQGWYCVITGTFSTLHYGGGLVSSGTYGLQEAINSAQNFGGMVVLDGTWPGNTGMITGAFGFANVSIEDLRGNAPVFYAWNGSAYVAQSGGGGSGTITSVFGRTTPAIISQIGDYTVAQITGAAPLASPTFTGTITLPLTGSAQCLQVNTSGVLSGTGTACGGSGSSPGGSSGNLQYNNGGVFAGVTDLSYASHTLSASASLILDLSAAPVLTGFKLPSAAGASPTSDGIDAFNTTIHAQVWGSNGNTIVGAAAALGNTAATTCSSMVVTAISSVAAPTCTALTGAFLPNPSASTLGGIQSFAAVTHQWINTISTSGVPSASQPTLADLNLGVATQPDNGASPTTAAFGVTDNASNALDNTTNWFTDTGSSSVHVSFAARIRGTNQLQVVEQTGPQGQVVVGSAVVPTSINNSPFAKFLILSNTATHTMERVYQNSTAATGTMVEWNNATVAGSGYNFFKACAGATGNDTGCGSGTTVASLTGAGVLTVQSCIGCGGLSGVMTTLGDLLYENVTPAAARLAGPTTYNGVAQMLVETASGGVAGAPSWAPGGVVTNAQTGTSYTIVLTDRLKYVSFNNAASVAVTLPQAGSTNFDANFAFVTKNLGAGTVTITPATSTINGSSSLTLTTGQWAFVYSDNTNYTALVNGSGGTVSSVATTGPISGGTITSSGTISCPTCVTSAASLTLNALVIGGGSQASQTVAGLTTDGVSVLTLGLAGTSVGGLAFKNATSGTITLQPVTGALGAITISLPAFTGTAAVATTSTTVTNALFATATAGAPAYRNIGTSDTSIFWYAVGGGTAQAQTVTLTPALTALTTGAEVRWLPTAANTAGAPTLAVNGLTAKTITKLGTTAVVANDLTTTAIADAIYDGTEWQLQNPQTSSGGGGLPSAAINTVAVGPADVPGGGSATMTAVASPEPLYFTDPRAWAYFSDDFITPVPSAGHLGQLLWGVNGTGGTGTAYTGSIVPYWGAATCTAGAVASNNCFIQPTNFPAYSAYDNFTKGDIIVRVLLGQTTNTNFFAGIANTNSSHGEASAGYAGIAYNVGDGDTGWMCVVGQAAGTGGTTTRTAIAGSTLNATAWHTLRIRWTAAKTISCSVDNGTEIAMTNTNWPTGNNAEGPEVSIDNNATTNSVNYSIDYFYHALGGVGR